MTRHRKSDSRWRGAAAAEVMAASLPRLELGDRVLLAGEASPALLDALAVAGARIGLWIRRADPASTDASGPSARAWPQDGPFTAALLRLPRAKDELDMMLHAAAARVVPGGIVAVYGANDEGIKSSAARVENLIGETSTAEQRAHCRVLWARVPEGLAGLKGSQSDWRKVEPLVIDGLERAWVSYPGTFAKGGLDAGTRLLLSALDGQTSVGATAPLTIASAPRALDFACGTGVIAAHLLSLRPQASIEKADHDALAVAAASENVPGGRALVAPSLRHLSAAGSAIERYDMIVSNPPIHAEKSEDYTVLGQLVAQAPEKLAANGSLVLVVQGRIPVGPWLSAGFLRVETILQDSRYRVWHAREPKRRPRKQ